MSTVVASIASLVDAIATCRKRSDTWNNCVEWEIKHTRRLACIARACLPSGSGIDAGTTVDLDASRPDRLVFRTSFHHMSEHGYYDGWTEHKVIVKPSLVHEFTVEVTGRDRNDIKAYLGDVFHEALRVALPIVTIDTLYAKEASDV